MKIFAQSNTSTTLLQGAMNITAGKSSNSTSTTTALSMTPSADIATQPTANPGLVLASGLATAMQNHSMGPTDMIPVSSAQVQFSDVFEIDDQRGLALLADLLPGNYVDDQSMGILSTEGDFTYQLRFFIDKDAAIRNSITKVVFKFFEEPSATASSAVTQDLNGTGLGNMKTSINNLKGMTAAYSQAVTALSAGPIAIASNTLTPTDSGVTSNAFGSTTLTPFQNQLIASTAAVGYFKETSIDLSSHLGIDEIPTATELAGSFIYAMPTTYTIAVNSAPSTLSSNVTNNARNISMTSQISVTPQNRSVNPINNMTVQRGGGLPTQTSGVSNSTSTNSALTAIRNGSLDPASIGQVSYSGPSLASSLGTNTTVLGAMGRSPYAMGNVSSKGINSVATMHALPNPVPFGSASPISSRISPAGSAGIGNVNSRKVLNSSALGNYSQDLYSSPTTKGSTAGTALALPSPPSAMSLVDLGTIQSNLIEIGPVNVSFGIEFLASREKFYCIVELMGDNGISPVASKEFTIQHKSMLSEFLIPHAAPAVSCTLSLGEVNNLMITQVDPLGTHVRIEKSVIDPDDLNSPLQIIEDELLVTPSMGSVIYTDSDANCYSPKSIIYRVHPIGPLGATGTNFGSTVVNGVPAPVPVPPGNSKYTVNLTAVNLDTTPGGLKIKITNIPENIGAISLLKKCYSLRGFPAHQEYTRVPIEGRDIKRLTQGRKSVSVVDNNVSSRFEYIYQVEVHPIGFASPEIANGYVLKEFIAPPTGRNVGGVTMSGFSYDTAIGGCSYTIKMQPTEFTFQQVFKLLEGAGVGQGFIQDFTENRSRLDEMASFLVTRHNLDTGEKHEFGIHPVGKFEDNPTLRAARGIPAIERGMSYVYNNELILTPPEGLFKDAVTDIQTQGKIETTEKVLAEKFYATMMGDGRTPSQRELDDIAASPEKFIFKGRTGIEVNQEYSAPGLPPEISSISASVNCLGHNSVQFSITGDRSQVDHFLVCCSFMGSTSVLGSVSVGQTPGNSYTFTDLELSREIGVIEYFVVIVKTNFTKVFNPAMSTTLTKETDVPSILLSDKHAPKPASFGNLAPAANKVGSPNVAKLVDLGGSSPIPGASVSKTGKFMTIKDTTGTGQSSSPSFKKRASSASPIIGSSATKRRSSSRSGAKPKRATTAQLKSRQLVLPAIKSTSSGNKKGSKTKNSPRSPMKRRRTSASRRKK